MTDLATNMVTGGIFVFLYLLLAARYSWYVNRTVDEEGTFAWLCGIVLFPIMYLCTHGDSRYSGFTILPKRPTAWDREKKRMAQEREDLKLSYEKTKALTEHRAYVDEYERKIRQINDTEERRLRQDT